MNVVGMGMIPQPNPQQPQQQQQQQPHQPLDNISKIKTLIGPLRESLSNTIKTAAQTLNQNSQVDAGSLKGVDVPIPRFDKNLEEFYSICDQIELHLKTSIKCIGQAESSNRYLHVPVIPHRSENIGINENMLSYPQFLATASAQVAYAKEIHDTLIAAAQNISPSD
ncbi:mediator of RNA polymerase II transcription subunit 29 [Tribolium castaneum]|uniref:Mediator of RNA polymerase II transcription subunit 29 n=1 Tax=Tribolium castaneum TaxID=7070 RepID=D6WGB4_TRICA|nr:PREDICTED: mediator of RNA polymerase II transcription subunit 29 [Tribolium castaneum]EFA01132.1 Mediator of RNA polymerase II transcription subunit 29-like Protein [Tribolium castaneum]|eukprot:XP_008198968.1 PREDICTED: mediator of RNA polymerase II transcription subunit 29 [Tribolium castaneum]